MGCPRTLFIILLGLPSKESLFAIFQLRSVRLVAEDVGVFKIHERKSAFDAYSDGEEIDPEEGGFKD